MLESIRNSANISHRGAALAGALALALPALWAAPTIRAAKPGGVDDTAILQAALDAGVAAGPGAIVQLAAGTYRTRQLVATNFQGAFRGAGQGATTIVARPNLPVDVPDSHDENWPLPSATCHWPILITFVNGDVHVSDLTIKVPAADGTATTAWINPTWGGTETGLYDIILFMGNGPTNALLERVTMEGVQDGYWWGYNVAMGADYSAYYPASPAPGDYGWMSGTFTVRNCTFKNMFNAISFDGRHQDCQVVIGGAPGAGNVGVNLSEGIDLELAQGSMFEVSFNQISGNWVGLWAVDTYSTNLGFYLPNPPSQFFVHDNTFSLAGSGVQGILLADEPTSPWIRASIYNNQIRMKTDSGQGILAKDTVGTAIWNNTISGTASQGIVLDTATLATVDGNNLAKLVTTEADVYLTTGTSDSRVTVNSAADTVVDQGSDDIVAILPPATTQNQQ